MVKYFLFIYERLDAANVSYVVPSDNKWTFLGMPSDSFQKYGTLREILLTLNTIIPSSFMVIKVRV